MSQFYPASFKRMADATLSQATPTTATLYTALDTTRNVRIHSVTASVTWTVQPTPLDVVITIDGNTVTHSFTDPVTATVYAIAESVAADDAAATAQVLATTLSATVLLAIYEGQSVKVEARTTGGTVSLLTARVKYSKLA